MHQTRSVTLVGAGKMGGAFLVGALRAGMPGSSITVIDPQPSQIIQELAGSNGISLNPHPEALREPNLLLLAVKPQMFDDALSALTMLAGQETLIVSLMAGKTIQNIRLRLPRGGAFVRIMPNLPAAVGRGVTVCYASPEVSSSQRAWVDQLLDSIGIVEWVENEDLIDAATAISGSGPAYVFYLVEALALAGVQAGLPPSLSARIARATVEGAGELMFREPNIEVTAFRQNVTSPSGPTAAALDLLMAADGLQPLLTAAVIAAKKRATELSD